MGETKRDALTSFDATDMDIDHGSWRSLVLAVDGNNFSGCMDLQTKKIYFAPLTPATVPTGAALEAAVKLHKDPAAIVAIVKKENEQRPTVAPRFPAIVGLAPIAPIIHSRLLAKTSHDQLVEHVVGAGKMEAGAVDRFCGFALRFEKDNRVALTGTSRSLNPDPTHKNGQLEKVIMDALFPYLSGELGKRPVNRTVYKAEATSSPVAIATQIGGAQVANARMAMNAQLAGGLRNALKPTNK